MNILIGFIAAVILFILISIIGPWMGFITDLIFSILFKNNYFRWCAKKQIEIKKHWGLE